MRDQASEVEAGGVQTRERATIHLVTMVVHPPAAGRGPLRSMGPTLTVLLHETALPSALEAALAPLRPVVCDVVAPPVALLAPAGEPLLQWLARCRSERPLLALTGARLLESSGHPLRGLSLVGEGIALVSAFGLSPCSVRGSVVHEVAHALGLDHCADGACALSVRLWPASVEDRGDSLCAACQRIWQTKLGGAA